jgi:hypothetical protein
MFIAIRAAQSAKLRRSGMGSCSLGHCRRIVEAKVPLHAAPTELCRAFDVVVAINMALLTELGQSPPKMRVRCSVLRRSNVGTRASPYEIGRIRTPGAGFARGRAHSDDPFPLALTHLPQGEGTEPCSRRQSGMSANRRPIGSESPSPWGACHYPQLG